jgi:hypothetical protein
MAPSPVRVRRARALVSSAASKVAKTSSARSLLRQKNPDAKPREGLLRYRVSRPSSLLASGDRAGGPPQLPGPRTDRKLSVVTWLSDNTRMKLTTCRGIRFTVRMGLFRGGIRGAYILRHRVYAGLCAFSPSRHSVAPGLYEVSALRKVLANPHYPTHPCIADQFWQTSQAASAEGMQKLAKFVVFPSSFRPDRLIKLSASLLKFGERGECYRDQGLDISLDDCV